MRTVDLIAKKRDNLPLSREEIDFLVQGYTKEEIPDYQMSVLLMAICWHGMTVEETVALTESIVRTGVTLDLSSISPVVADKHSTGGVGDKTTLVVAPLVAASGVAFAKMAGRGLGFTGGTIDKFESFPGFNVSLSKEKFLSNLRQCGIAVTSQTPELAPADGKLYALRDVTATVESIPLIASSVMSKKIATGANIIALDVKTGVGAFMKTLEQAHELAQLMVRIGEAEGRRTFAIISGMNEPLGNAIGNVLEVKEAIEALRGNGPEDLRELSLTVSARILVSAGKEPDLDLARKRLEDLLDSGIALNKLAELVESQGGDPRQVYEPETLETAPIIETVKSPTSGYISYLNAQTLGLSAMQLGAGRAQKGALIDHGVGLVLAAKIGDFVSEGDPLVTLYARSWKDLELVAPRIVDAYSFSEQPVTKSREILEVVESLSQPQCHEIRG